MTASEASPDRVRRAPPPFRTVTVQRVEQRSPRLVRVTLSGPSLAGFVVDAPAASVRLLLPSPGSTELVIPEWMGNEFLLPDGSRPVIRTFTPRRNNETAGELDLEIVIHGDGAASRWAAAAEPGLPAAVSGPGRGYAIDPSASGFLLAGDETAIPAVSQLLEAIPGSTPVDVQIEVADPNGRLPMPEHPAARVSWHELPPGAPPGDALIDAVEATLIDPGTRVWVAGEAAAVQRIRRHLFETRGLPRTQCTVRGYWKVGRAGDEASGPS